MIGIERRGRMLAVSDKEQIIKLFPGTRCVDTCKDKQNER
jgi:hypothetical protein